MPDDLQLTKDEIKLLLTIINQTPIHVSNRIKMRELSSQMDALEAKLNRQLIELEKEGKKE